MLVIASAIQSERDAFVTLPILLENNVPAHSKYIQLISIFHADVVPFACGYARE